MAALLAQDAKHNEARGRKRRCFEVACWFGKGKGPRGTDRTVPTLQKENVRRFQRPLGHETQKKSLFQMSSRLGAFGGGPRGQKKPNRAAIILGRGEPTPSCEGSSGRQSHGTKWAHGSSDLAPLSFLWPSKNPAGRFRARQSRTFPTLIQDSTGAQAPKSEEFWASPKDQNRGIHRMSRATGLSELPQNPGRFGLRLKQRTIFGMEPVGETGRPTVARNTFFRAQCVI